MEGRRAPVGMAPGEQGLGLGEAFRPRESHPPPSTCSAAVLRGLASDFLGLPGAPGVSMAQRCVPWPGSPWPPVVSWQGFEPVGRGWPRSWGLAQNPARLNWPQYLWSRTQGHCRCLLHLPVPGPILDGFTAEGMNLSTSPLMCLVGAGGPRTGQRWERRRPAG